MISKGFVLEVLSLTLRCIVTLVHLSVAAFGGEAWQRKFLISCPSKVVACLAAACGCVLSSTWAGRSGHWGNLADVPERFV